MRPIDGDALSAKMYHDAFETDSDMQKWDSGCWIRYKMFEKNLAEAPTIESPERKTGRWLDNGLGLPRCSQCGRKAYGYHFADCIKSDFCPHCGADMRGGDAE